MKSKLKKILVPIDGSKNSIRGLDVAITIARASNATITAITVKSVPGIYAIHPMGFVYTEPDQDIKKFLNNAKIRAAKKGIKVTSKIIQGDPGFDIVKFANSKKNKFDLIIIGARGRTRVEEIFLGSVSNYILHKSNMPVMVVK